MFIAPLSCKPYSTDSYLQKEAVSSAPKSSAAVLKTLQRDECTFGNAKKNAANPGFEINGKYTKAQVFAQTVDYDAYNQIKTFCDHPIFKDAKISIMPDVHAGKTSVVGFSAKMRSDEVFMPSIIGSDIGCGMLCVKLDTKDKPMDFRKLDDVIRKYISGKSTVTSRHKTMPADFAKKLNEVTTKTSQKRADFYEGGLGTLGGGNHFIEIDKDQSGELYLVVHSGSKTLGKDVYDYYQKLAQEQNPYSIKEMSYLTGDKAKEYLGATKATKEYAQLNRRVIANIIMSEMGWREKTSFESIHNYISDDNTIRKGAISAQEAENLIIPINMKDGAILAKGKGNTEWNHTAPHGAGRKFSRGEAKDRILYDDYKATMSGVYSTCVTPQTLSESPQAYRSVDEIAELIADTADITEFIEPIYNFKG